MPTVYCPVCQCNILLEQDGKTCANCGAVIVGAPATTPQAKKPKRRSLPQRQTETLPDPMTQKKAEEEHYAATHDTADAARDEAHAAAEAARTAPAEANRATALIEDQKE